jgi:hypothetical protein
MTEAQPLSVARVGLGDVCPGCVGLLPGAHLVLVPRAWGSWAQPHSSLQDSRQERTQEQSVLTIKVPPAHCMA